MTTPQPRPAREYHLSSPGEGVYRVILEEVATGTAAQAFFTGIHDVETVRLPPGDYLSAITDVGKNLVVAGERVRLPDVGGLVALPRFQEPIRRSGLGSGRAASGLNTRASTMMDARSSRGSADGAAADRQTGHRESLRDASPDRGMTADGRAAASLLFDAALSEDVAPGSIGGWRAPVELSVTTNRDGETGALRIEMEDRAQVRRSRLRLTVGIEGRPAIRVPLPLFLGGLAVTITPTRTVRGPDVQVEVAARDVRTQGLLVALGDLDPEEAASVVTWASGTQADAVAVLADKSRDLWAAAAAALVLTRIGRLEEVADWSHNLARLAPHIADAGVVAAWATLGFGNGPNDVVEDHAMDLLRRSARTGAPTFTAGNSLLLEVLGGLRASAIQKRVARQADAEYRRATRRSRSRVFRSPLMIWEQSGERLQGGRLRGPRYFSVAHGELVGGERPRFTLVS